MDYVDGVEGQLAINIGLGQFEEGGFYALVILDVTDDSGDTRRFALGDADETAEFVEMLLGACTRASDLDDLLEGLEDKMDAEAAMMAYAMRSSASDN